MDNSRSLPAKPASFAARGIVWLLVALVVFVVVLHAALSSDPIAVGLVVGRAAFQAAGGPVRVVALPHTWALDGLPGRGAGRYRIEIDLARAPDTAWSLGADRISSRSAVRINGALVPGTLPTPDPTGVAAPIPAVFDVPSALLHPGRNVAEIDVEFDERGGMSTLRIGPAAWVHEAYARTQALILTVPQWLGVGAAMLALFMLAMWLHRRSGRELSALSAFLVVALARDVISARGGADRPRAARAGARRALRRAVMALATLLVIVIPVHDYFFLRGTTSVMDRHWLPFATPLLLLVVAWALLDRLAGALVAMQTQAGELELKVVERTRALAVANAAKTRFLAAASHDLRQPVVSISLLSELLREQPLPASSEPILARMSDSVQALSRLLKSLLDLSRFDAGVVTARPSLIALRPLLERVTGDEAEAARRQGITLRVLAPAVNVHSDPILLEQILRNLVGNAVRCTLYGGVLVTGRPRGADCLLLQVWDTGPGIPLESQAQVFDEFVQLDNAAGEGACGLGLGLSLVQRAAGVLGVCVTLRSAPGKGSCFSVEVPLAASEPALDASVPAGDVGLEGRRVWVVEDDPAVREALRMRFAGWGAQARAFADVDSFRQALAGDTPELLVVDQRLPDGTGIDVARLLQARDASVPLLVVTGDTAPNDIAMLRASGLPVLHKPFTSDELWAALRAQGVAGRKAD